MRPARGRSLWKRPALITALILLIPVMGQIFVEGWHWRLPGFVLAGALVFGTALTYELVTRKAATLAYRVAVGIALVSFLPLVWGNFVQAADDVNPAALLYLWVPVVGILGTALARFKPNPMSYALFAMAVAQVVILSIALTRNPPMTTWTAPVWRGFAMNGLMVGLFVGSALLFRSSARAESAPGPA